jgi:ribosomal protein S6
MIYEINFLVLQSKTSELEKIRKEIKDFIKSFDAEIVEEKKYLKRKLAYEIQHENYGFFTVLRFQFKNKTNLDELKLKLNQRNNVARYIIVRADELPSLKEQDTEKLEKIHTGKKSIKSEDLEKALVEQKRSKKETETVEKKSTEEKTETTKKEEKPKNTKKSTKKTEGKESAETKTTKEKTTSPTANKKTTEEKDEDVSLDELDKKLDEILNS